MTYLSSKTFDNLDLSTMWRRWTSVGDGLKLRGAVLNFKLILEAAEEGALEDLDDEDFYASVAGWLKMTFQNQVLVDNQDPDLQAFLDFHQKGVATVMVVPEVGLEAFAEMSFGSVEGLLEIKGYDSEIRVHSVECWDQRSRTALYARDDEFESLDADKVFSEMDLEPSMADTIVEDPLSGLPLEDQEGDDFEAEGGQQMDGSNHPPSGQ